LGGLPVVAATAPVLRSAHADVTIGADARCTVALTVHVEGADEVEHRIGVSSEGRATVLSVDGAVIAGPPYAVGVTRVLVLRPQRPAYTLRYVVEDARLSGRCALWIPVVPTEGRAASVRVSVDVPDDMTAAATWPALTWTGIRGETVLGHLPAFVRVPLVPPGGARGWDVGRVMDVVSLTMLGMATLVWVRRRRGGRR
jgi:hypothetical protein